jgi:hypothetical protein
MRCAADWMPYVLTENSADITNHYIGDAIVGGLPRLFLFVLIIVVCFRTVWMVVRRFEGKFVSDASLVRSL